MAAIDDRIAELERQHPLPPAMTADECLEAFERTGERWYLTMAGIARNIDAATAIFELEGDGRSAPRLTLIRGGDHG